MEPEFPLEFIVHGTPVSFQRDNSRAKTEWKELVKASSQVHLPEMHFATDRPLAVTLFYFPPEPMEGDVDNIVKLVLDALSQHVYLDDSQVERVVVQKFEPARLFRFTDPSERLIECMLGNKPALYIRLSADPFEDL